MTGFDLEKCNVLVTGGLGALLHMPFWGRRFIPETLSLVYACIPRNSDPVSLAVWGRCVGTAVLDYAIKAHTL